MESFQQKRVTSDVGLNGFPLPGAGSLLDGIRGKVDIESEEMLGDGTVAETEESVRMLLDQQTVDDAIEDHLDEPDHDQHEGLHDEPVPVCLQLQHETVCKEQGSGITQEDRGPEVSKASFMQGGMQLSQEVITVAGSPKQQQECSGCKKSIIDRFLLKAMDQYWHEDCLKCSCCDCRLGEVGSTLFAKSNLLLCRRDYLRLFGTTGYCSACAKMIPAFEMVMRAKNNVYHLECFACQMCNHRFCVGDKFYLCDNKILCEYDYEERMVFANMTYNYNALSQIKRQTNSLSDDLSSGYGSPSPGSL